MADNQSDSVCCSSMNLEDNSYELANVTGDYEVGYWNVETDDVDEEPTNLEVDVFSGDISSISYMDNAVFLEFPKFSKGYQRSDFSTFVQKYVGEENVEKLESWKYPSLWILVVKGKEIREKLLRMWKTKIKNKTCCITPYHNYELRGFLHGLPYFISDDDIKTQLNNYGEVLILEKVAHDQWSDRVVSDVRYFGLRLKSGMVKNDMPHFLKFSGYRTLVIVRGRQPACFHCREFGHSKKDCQKYKEKLDEYCKNPVARKPRTKPRGRRHQPKPDVKSINKLDKSQDKIKSNLTSSVPSPKQYEPSNFCPEQTFSGRKTTVNQKSEISAILLSLKKWEEKTLEMLEQTLVQMELNLKKNFASTKADEKSIEITNETIKLCLEEMKQAAREMIKKTSNNLKMTVAKHFKLDSNELPEEPIADFRICENIVK